MILGQSSSSHSKDYPFSIQSEVEVDILDRSWLILVPLSLPGERVLAKITANGPGLSTARLMSLISRPSPKRNKPKCLHFGECNGCNLQHLHYEEQLRLKEASVKAIFSKICCGDKPVFRPILPSPLQYGFRNKLTPHYTRSNRTPPGFISNIGFNGVDGKVVDIKSCSVIDPSINEAYQNVRKALHERWQNVNNPPQNSGATLLLRRKVSIDCKPVPMILSADDVSEKAQHEKVSIVLGNGPDIICSEVIDGVKFSYAACNFFQTNPKAVTECIRILKKELRENYSHLTHLLDIYCGVGLFAILLQSIFTKIIGIESDQRSVQFARLNAKNIPGEDRTISKTLPLRFLAGDAASWLSNPKLFSFLPADKTVVILDPPRVGCTDSLINCLLEYQPQLIIYVSCYPLTQAADISKLLSLYQVKYVQPMDFFPQSHHVENMAFLEKRPSAQF
ncbi:TrmA family RNA methyltransferase [Mitosporidium daphniae]|uniref:TrmA family RNA methyltransferase n=1 Tax=Mitosporidium daphniae TaxID=1485682 RepID=A0A098VVH3_9MICR|nr:TrmA family RNA methyltransferase [Mitosporidium daphniae]KGG51736.1 TrmA family RNA methyltransferase [Mitosporidium daphniae]|eukprot:XP_013238164.1 TrmA family RNA methyltransferase [Mitosporidium daphniae]